jgi:hypothetical protein
MIKNLSSRELMAVSGGMTMPPYQACEDAVFQASTSAVPGTWAAQGLDTLNRNSFCQALTQQDRQQIATDVIVPRIQ